MHPVLERIRTVGLVPVIKLNDPESALPLGRALVAGGIPVAEITFRTAAAEEAIRRLAADLPELLVGAGTVLTVEQARIAVDAGARFLVSPALNPDVVAVAIDMGIPVVPGVSGPDGVDRALRLGLEAVKLFPAEATGGLRMLDALSGPYDTMNFIPTGGIDAANAGEYLKRKNVIAVGGTWMAAPALIEGADWAVIEAQCGASALAMHGFSFAHVGINGASDAEARDRVKLLGSLFGMKFSEGAASFMGDGIELTKSPFPGEPGHLGIRVNDVGRALAWLARRGVKPIPGTERWDGTRLKAVYLELELTGLAVHLVA